MADSAASAAAVAGLIDDIMADQQHTVSDLSGNGTPVPVDPGDLTGNYTRVPAEDGVAVYAPVAAPEQGEQSAPEEQPDAPSLPSWSADLSGIEDIFTEDDPPPFIDEEPEPAPTFNAEPEPESWDDDDEKRRLKAELVKAQKQLAWQRDQAAKAQLKEWRAEASRRFPFSDPESIQGTSRRGVLREAARQHQAVEKKVKPLTDALEALRTETITEAKQQAREEAKQAWGAPRQAPGPAQVVEAEDASKYDRRNYRSPHDLIRAKLLGGKYGPV